MHLLLIIGAAILFVFIAPLKVTAFTALSLLIIGLIGQRVAQSVTGAPAAVGDVFRSVGLAFAFVTLLAGAILTVGGNFSGFGAILLLAGFLVAYIGGFKIGMGIEMGPAAIVAAVSTAVSIALFFTFKALL